MVVYEEAAVFTEVDYDLFTMRLTERKKRLIDSYFYEGDFYVYDKDGSLSCRTENESDMASDPQELNWRRAMYPRNPENNKAIGDG